MLSLYINGKLKPWSNYRPMSWEIPVVVAPLLGAMLIACSVLVNADHTAGDVLVGAFNGSLCALVMYRAFYASVWDWRFNHIPLRPREVQEYEVAGENVQGVVLHKGMWEQRVGRNIDGRKTGYWRRRNTPGVIGGGVGEGQVNGAGGGPGGGNTAGGSRVVGDQVV